MEVYFSLGSNTGDRRKNLDTALQLLEEAFGQVRAVSRFIETEPWGFTASTTFLNAAARFDVIDPDPYEILRVCKDIERRMGRTDAVEFDSDGKRVYHSRIIDIDILFIGTMRIDSPELTVPHPLAAVRDFVKIPLREVVTEEFLSGENSYVFDINS